MSVFSITFGESVENHVGMQQIGQKYQTGYSVEELIQIGHYFQSHGGIVQFYQLDNALNEYFNLNSAIKSTLKQTPQELAAAILVIKNGIQFFRTTSQDLFQELIALPSDKKALMRGKVVNKNARYNLCFADFEQAPDYEIGKGTVINFNKMRILKHIRDHLHLAFGDKARNINAELNHYYDLKKCGIGFHGDTERRVVICFRCGNGVPLEYQWFHQFKPVGGRIRVEVEDGDVYIMSDKAVGHDWKKSSLYTLRHAAGADKYLTTKKD